MKYILSVHNDHIFTAHDRLKELGYHVIFYTSTFEDRHYFEIHLHSEEQLLAIMLQIPCQKHTERTMTI
jgi:hypothetical protein